MPKIEKVAILGASVLVVQIILGMFIYPLLGSSLNNYLVGLPEITLSFSSLFMVVTLFALVYVGMFIYEQKTIKLWQGKNHSQRIFAMLLYTHIILYVLLLTRGILNPINTLIGVGINLVMISLVLIISSNKLNFPRI